jgi:hypothetical protein
MGVHPRHFQYPKTRLRVNSKLQALVLSRSWLENAVFQPLDGCPPKDTKEIWSSCRYTPTMPVVIGAVSMSNTKNACRKSSILPDSHASNTLHLSFSGWREALTRVLAALRPLALTCCLSDQMYLLGATCSLFRFGSVHLRDTLLRVLVPGALSVACHGSAWSSDHIFELHDMPLAGHRFVPACTVGTPAARSTDQVLGKWHTFSAVSQAQVLYGRAWLGEADSDL